MKYLSILPAILVFLFLGLNGNIKNATDFFGMLGVCIGLGFINYYTMNGKPAAKKTKIANMQNHWGNHNIPLKPAVYLLITLCLCFVIAGICSVYGI